MSTYTLCSVGDVKAMLGITADTYDADISALTLQVTKQIEKMLGVTMMCADSDVTEYFDVDEDGWDELFVQYRPVTAVTSVYEDPDRDYESASLLTNDDDYVWYSNRIYRVGGAWARGHKVVKLTYRGGYHDVGDVPWDLRRAATKACSIEWQQHYNGDGRLGLTGKSYNSGNASFIDGWPADVVDVLGMYARGNVGFM